MTLTRPQFGVDRATTPWGVYHLLANGGSSALLGTIDPATGAWTPYGEFKPDAGGSGGVKGVVPAPAAGDAVAGKFLSASGGWVVPPTPPPPSVFTADSGSAPGTKGLVPAPAAGDAATGKYLGVGGWSVPPAASVFTGATGSANGTKGVVPQPAINDFQRNRVLGAGGGWVVPMAGVHIDNFGGAGDGATNNDAAWTAALAAVAAKAQSPVSSKVIIFGPGRYRFSAQIAYAFAATFESLSVFGCGAEVTELYWPAAGGGLQLNLATAFNSFRIRDMALTAGVANGGTALSIRQTAASIPNPANNAISDVTNVTIRGADTQAGSFYWTTGIDVLAVNNVNFFGLNIVGGGNGAYSTQGTGVTVRGDKVGSTIRFGVVYNFTSCIFDYLNIGLSYGNEVQGLTISQCNFTGCNIGLNAPGSQENLVQLYIGGSQFNCNGNVLIQSAINFAFIIGNYFLVPPGNGIYFVTPTQVSIIGNGFSPAGGSGTKQGILLGSANGNVGAIVSGNSFLNLTVGVGLVSGANSTVQGNLYQGNGTNVSNTGTGSTVGVATA